MDILKREGLLDEIHAISLKLKDHNQYKKDNLN